MTLISTYYNHLQPQTESAPHRNFSSNNKFGIELELENVPQEAWSTRFKYWQIVNESSLRNSGAEFVLKKPLNGDALFRAVGELFNHRIVQASDPSWRCGIHIHIDVRHWSVGKLAAFGMYYLAAEQELFEQFGSDRLYSNFCVPLGFQPRLMRSLFSGAVRNLNDSCKYSALNFLPMQQQGSIEWRAASASVSSTTMRAILIAFCNLIKQADDFVAAENKGELIRELFPLDDTYFTVLYFRRPLANNLAELARRFDPERADARRRQRSLLNTIAQMTPYSEEYEEDSEDDEDYDHDED